MKDTQHLIFLLFEIFIKSLACLICKTNGFSINKFIELSAKIFENLKCKLEGVQIIAESIFFASLIFFKLKGEFGYIFILL